MTTNSNIYNNIYKKYLNKINKGVYVECGAIDGIHRSLTIELYKNGWSGFNFEPNIRTFKKLCINRLDDINLNLCLSNENNIVEFNIPKGNVRGYETGTGSILKNVTKNREFITEKVESITFDRFVDYYKVKKIDFMVLDVEGHELEVLERFKHSKVRPTYLLIETALINRENLLDLISDYYIEDELIDVGWENNLYILKDRK